MKILIVNNYGSADEYHEEFECEMVEFEDQTLLKNGMWLHIYQKDNEFSYEFDPRKDVFRIIK